MRKYIPGLMICALAFAAAPASAEEIKISRDGFGVAHVFAETDGGAMYGQGYAQACDRLFQLEITRLSASGRMAEAMGAEYIDFDRMYLRYFPSGDDLKEFVKGLDPEQVSMFSAFAAGINRRIDEVTAANAVPSEFSKYGIEPVKWTVTDVVRVYLARHRNIYDSDEELKNLALLNKLINTYGKVDGALIFDSIVKPSDHHATTVVSGIKGYEKAIKAAQHNEDISRKLMASFGVPYGAGSYAAAIAASKSETGNSLLLAGPQYGFSSPSIFYECSLHSKHLHAAGIQSIGIPGIAIGQNESGAWTMTGGNDNQIDYFIEMLNPSDNSQYRLGNEWKTISRKTYVIPVKNGKDEEFDVLTTANGMIVTTELSDSKNPVAYSKKTAVTPQELASSWMNSYNAMKTYSSESFINAVKTYPVAANFMYINRKNPPLYIHTGKYPVRAEGTDDRLPSTVPAEEAWKGFVETGKLPVSRIPSRGFYADWDSKPSVTWNNGEKAYQWGSQNRVNDIRNYIDNAGKFAFRDLSKIDSRIAYMDIYCHGIKPLLEEKLEKSSDSSVKEAAGYLKAWDGMRRVSQEGYYQEPGPVILHEWMRQFVKEVCPELTGEFSEYAINSQGAPFVYDIMRERELPYDFLKGRSSDEVCETAMKKAISALSEKNGSKMGAWTAKTNLSSYKETAGNVTSGPSFYSGNRASSVFMWEVNRYWVKGNGVVPPGEGIYGDGSHVSDQRELYNTGHYKNILFYEEDIRHDETSADKMEAEW